MEAMRCCGEKKERKAKSRLHGRKCFIFSYLFLDESFSCFFSFFIQSSSLLLSCFLQFFHRWKENRFFLNSFFREKRFIIRGIKSNARKWKLTMGKLEKLLKIRKKFVRKSLKCCGNVCEGKFSIQPSLTIFGLMNMFPWHRTTPNYRVISFTAAVARFMENCQSCHSLFAYGTILMSKSSRNICMLCNASHFRWPKKMISILMQWQWATSAAGECDVEKRERENVWIFRMHKCISYCIHTIEFFHIQLISNVVHAKCNMITWN